jgi:hypothetical protein
MNQTKKIMDRQFRKREERLQQQDKLIIFMIYTLMCVSAIGMVILLLMIIAILKQLW